MSKNENLLPEDILNVVLGVLEDKKAEDVTVIDIKKKAFFADYIVIANGTSSRHLQTIADFIVYELKKQKFDATIEGDHTSDWVLVDTGFAVVNLFKPEARAFYNLEKMWSVEV